MLKRFVHSSDWDDNVGCVFSSSNLIVSSWKGCTGIPCNSCAFNTSNLKTQTNITLDFSRVPEGYSK